MVRHNLEQIYFLGRSSASGSKAAKTIDDTSKDMLAQSSQSRFLIKCNTELYYICKLAREDIKYRWVVEHLESGYYRARLFLLFVDEPCKGTNETKYTNT